MQTSLWAVLILLGFNCVPSSSKCSWDSCPAYSNDGKVNIHLIAHSHDDMGWLKTADDYFMGVHMDQVHVGVQYIIDSMLSALKRDPARKMVYAEVGFLTRWLETRPAKDVQDLVALVNNGQLEFVGGGWVQPDEAATHYVDLIDQYTLGLRRLSKVFGSECGHPRIGWQLDPFGHSREHANILKLLGYDGLVFARQHYLEFEARKANKSTEFNWFCSDENASRSLATASFDMYFSPPNMCWDELCGTDPVQNNANFDNVNTDYVVKNLKDYVEQQRLPIQPHKHVLFTMGSDFLYQNAELYMRNIDALIQAVAANTDYRIFYSTPACYFRAVQESGVVLLNKTTDFFPYGSGPHDYWTGYFTSKPALKGLVRQTSNLLNTVRQLNAYAARAGLDEWTSPEQALERAAGLAQHHDGITGTSKEHVTQNYEMRILKAWTQIEAVFQAALQAINARVKQAQTAFPVQVFCRQLNESACDLTQKNREFSVVVSNGHSQDVQQLVRVPIWDTGIALVDDQDGSVEQAWILPTFLNGLQINNSQASPYDLQFLARVPAHGFNTYFVVAAGRRAAVQLKAVQEVTKRAQRDAPASISNGLIAVNFGYDNLVQSVVDIAAGVSYPLRQRFMYYEGHDDRGRASGAYIFRPQSNTPASVSDAPQLSTAHLEARQTFADYASQVVRLVPNQTFVEFEWTVGPLPSVDRNGKTYGKELFVRYETAIGSGPVFYTDSNGRQLLRRTRDKNQDYVYSDDEPVAANMYPVNAVALLKDAQSALAVLVDRSQAGGSIVDGTLDLLLHRRLFYDDEKGVDENLNEPGRDGRGLVVRGKHRVLFGAPATIARRYREQAQELFHQPVLAFSPFSGSPLAYAASFVTRYSGLRVPLAGNVKVVTLKQLSPGSLLLRLEHVYAVNEDSALSQPATVDISNLFKELKVTAVQETLLGSNLPLPGASTSTQVTLNPQDMKTFIVTVTM